MPQQSALEPSSWPPGPARPPAPAREVHVWRANLEAGWPGAEKLPTEERSRAESFLSADLGRRWAASRWALRRVLERYLDEEPAAIELEIGEHGKPRLATAGQRLDFNLSHSGDLLLVAAAVDRQVGVDLERIDPDRNLVAIAERELDPGSARAVREAAGARRAAAFYAAWVRHEAALKCFGGGLGGPAPAAPAVVTTLSIDRGYAAALAVAGADAAPIRCYSIAPSRASAAD